MSCGVGKNYWQPKDRRVYVNCPRVTIDEKRVAVRFSEELTPLDIQAAPKLWKLPPEFREPLSAEFWAAVEAGGWPEKYAARESIGAAVDALMRESLDIAYDFDEIEIRSKRYAEVCQRIPDADGAAAFCEVMGIEAPAIGARSTDAGRLARCR